MEREIALNDVWYFLDRSIKAKRKMLVGRLNTAELLGFLDGLKFARAAVEAFREEL